MLNVLKATVITAGTFYGYYKLTKFETNVTIEKNNTKSCFFGKVDRQTVSTNKGEFVLHNYLCSTGPKFEYEPILKLDTSSAYHITGSGVDYPKFHLYRTITSQNGSPCSSDDHCAEKPSLLSQVLKNF